MILLPYVLVLAAELPGQFYGSLTLGKQDMPLEGQSRALIKGASDQFAGKFDAGKFGEDFLRPGK